MKRKLWLVVVIIFISIYWSSSVRGWFDAHCDLISNKHIVKTYGLGALWEPYYMDLLSKRYGIKLRYVAGCEVDSSIVSYVSAYNSVSCSAVIHVYGKDIFEECSMEAQIQYYQQDANKGNVISMWRLGHLYYSHQKGYKAIEWFRKAASHNCTLSMEILSFIYETGDVGVKKDLKEAAKWYRKAKEHR